MENLQDWNPLETVGPFEHQVDLVNSAGETRRLSYERWKFEEACFHFVSETVEETGDKSWGVDGVISEPVDESPSIIQELGSGSA